jgi:hypothetical protein
MSGFPPERLTAPTHGRYVGKYYYCDYWREWDLVTRVDGMYWYVRESDLNGNPTTPERRHCTPLWANRFADKPFEVFAHHTR